jgi:hypothetical protein
MATEATPATSTSTVATTSANATPSAPSTTQGTAQAAPASAQATPVATEATPAQPAEASKTPQSDPIADAMAEINKMRREVSAKKDGLVSREKQLADKLALADTMDQVRAAVASKDYAGALQMLAGEGFNLDEASVLLFDQANAKDAKPLTQADVERIASEKAKAEREAAEKASSDQQAAALEQSKQEYVASCVQVLRANQSRFPLVARRGVSDEELFEWVLPSVRGGVAPTIDEALAHFEAQYVRDFEAEAKAMGYTRAEIAAAKADAAADAKSPAAAVPVPDTRGTATERKTEGQAESIAEMTRRHKAELKARTSAR